MIGVLGPDIMGNASHKLCEHTMSSHTSTYTFYIGDDPFWRWLISVYHAYERRLRANGGDGSEAAYALENLLRELQVVLVRDNYTAIMRLVEDR